MRALCGICALLCALAIGSAAAAAEFPSRPVRIVVPSTPGGAFDVLARVVSPKLAAKWGQQIVVDNRAGAGGVVGSEIVAKAAPDAQPISWFTDELRPRSNSRSVIDLSRSV